MEEIIIDGVNVAGCECYSKETGLCNYELSCNLKSNCVFKVNALKEQLKRLEQKYNEVLKLAKKNADSNEYVIQELEKENEELKKAYSNLNSMYNDNCDYTGKLENVLEEIKRMVKGHKIADETRLQAIGGLINKVLESEEQ